ncbi:MAG: hypothetical protein LC114_13215 [Bryobacterales bacterium]|nr:hypothetical protein [Bryobacterales bacterium]
MGNLSIVAPILAVVASAVFIPLWLRLSRGRRTLVKLQEEILALRAEAEWLRTERDSVQQEMGVAQEELRQVRTELSFAASEIACFKSELDHTRVRAREAGVTKSLFVANMSHELRTPLNGILGLARNLLDSDLSSRQRSEVELIHVAGEDLMRIINDVLDLSKLDAGKLVLEQTPFDLCGLLEGAFSLLYPQAERKELAYGLTYSHKIRSKFVGDPFRLRQIVLNLLSNAIKFTKHGSVILHAAEAEAASGVSWMRLEVVDTGIGIQPEQLRMIFDEFQQADLSTTRKYGGTGLGLSLSKRLVELMGGEIAVQSTSGEGSRFIVQVPLIPAPVIEPDEASPEPQSLDGVRVLVQEHRANQIQVLLKMLEALPGVVVERFTTAEDAAERILEPRSPDAGIEAVFTSESSSMFSAEAARGILKKCTSRPPLCFELSETAVGRMRPKPGMAVEVLPAPLLPSALISHLYRARCLPDRPVVETEGLPTHNVCRDSLPCTREPMSVLVAHENPVELRLLEAMLQRLGCTFISAHTAEELVSVLAGGEWTALLIQGRLLEKGSARSLTNGSTPNGEVPRLALIGEASHEALARLSESRAEFTQFRSAPRISELREFLNAAGS